MEILKREHKTAYWEGLKNRLIRSWFYLSKGVSILNEFRNLFIVILGGYIALKLNNPWLLVVIFIPSIIALLVLGFIWVHHMSKVIEFLNVRFATHYALLQYTLLEQIRDEIKKMNGKENDKT